MILYAIRYVVLNLMVMYQIKKMFKIHNSSRTSSANFVKNDHFDSISLFNATEIDLFINIENNNMALNYDDIDINKINFENSYISPISFSHISDIITVEESSFGSPWSKEEFSGSIKNRVAYGIFIDFKEHRVLAGYLFYVNAGDEIMITNIAIHPKFRRRKLGTKLIESNITSKFRKSENWRPKIKISTVTFNCDNLLASLFFKSLGYKWVQTTKIQCDKECFEEYENYVLKMTYEDFLNKYNINQECKKN